MCFCLHLHIHLGAGVLVYNSFLRNVRMRAILFWVTVACTIASLTQLILVTGKSSPLHFVHHECFKS